MSRASNESYQDAYIHQLDARLDALENNELYAPKPPKSSKLSVRRHKKTNTTQNSEIKAISAPASARSTKIARPKQFNHVEMQKFIDAAYQKKPLRKLEIHQYEKVLAVLQDQKQEAISKKHFKDSMDTQEAIEYIEIYYKQALKEQSFQEVDSKFQIKMDDYYDSLRKFDEETKELEEEFIEKKKKAKKLILDSQKGDLLDLQEYWSSPAKQRLYNRASTHLVNLRKRQIDEVNLNHLSEAGRLQKYISRLEKEESAANSEALQNDYNAALDKLLQKHKHEMDTFEFQMNVQLTSLRQKRENLRQRFIFRKQNLERKRELDKSTSMYGSSASRRSTRSLSYASTPRKQDPIRTRALDNVYKDISSISLKPIVFRVPK